MTAFPRLQNNNNDNIPEIQNDDGLILKQKDNHDHELNVIYHKHDKLRNK